MIREPKEVDFSTTGRTPSDEEFAHIGELIAARKASLRKKAQHNRDYHRAAEVLGNTKEWISSEELERKLGI